MSKWFPRLFCVVLTLLTVSFHSKAQLSAQFTATPTGGCAPLIVYFQDASTGNPTQWKWDLGNGTISYLQHPTVTYFNPGTYTVKLVVQKNGSSDSIVKSQYITIHALPVVSFAADNRSGCPPFAVQFTNTASAGSGTLSSFLWDFGDGTMSTQANPQHVYTASGNYNVSLKVTNSEGCSQTFYQANYITAFPGVESAFSITDAIGCSAPHTANFQAQSTGNGLLTYSWNFGDGGTSTLANPSHIYTNAGIYNVTLITTSADGCKDTLVKQNAVNVGALAPAFTTSPACEGLPVIFTNTSAPQPDSVLWTFGDGSFSNNINPIKTYAAAGNYPVKLLAYFGTCKDSVTRNITVAPAANINFSTTDTAACKPPHQVRFHNSTTGAVNYIWHFGDGNTSTETNPVHTYTSAGAFTVMLVAINANGCSDTLVKNDYIKIQLPQVTINDLRQRGCAPFSWTFSSTINSVEPVIAWAWDFGDGSTSNQQNPTHIFQAGIYDTRLIITTAGGCQDTAIVPSGITASTKPQPAFSATPRDVCAFNDVHFSDQTTGTVDEWLWLFGDGGSSTAQHPVHQYQDTGMFSVTLIAGNNGCYDTIRIPDCIVDVW